MQQHCCRLQHCKDVLELAVLHAYGALHTHFTLPAARVV
jgi:hypothetical protein